VKDNQIVGISVFDSMKSQTASSIKRWSRRWSGFWDDAPKVSKKGRAKKEKRWRENANQNAKGRTWTCILDRSRCWTFQFLCIFILLPSPLSADIDCQLFILQVPSQYSHALMLITKHVRMILMELILIESLRWPCYFWWFQTDLSRNSAGLRLLIRLYYLWYTGYSEIQSLDQTDPWNCARDWEFRGLAHSENILNGTRSRASDPIHEMRILWTSSVSGLLSMV
jgi:hypothetical protein